jgi:cyclic dehypoxanthinyl futalosine synthase
MNSDLLLHKALAFKPLSVDEGLFLYENVPTGELIAAADVCRCFQTKNDKVGWIIDRNINITNVCISGCRFCNFHCKKGDDVAYITTIEEYIPKIEELFHAGGNQVLLQGGMHPQLGLDYYSDLFRQLKSHFPTLKLHALGPRDCFYCQERKGNISLHP